jgi:hypothetical protein
MNVVINCLACGPLLRCESRRHISIESRHFSVNVTKPTCRDPSICMQDNRALSPKAASFGVVKRGCGHPLVVPHCTLRSSSSETRRATPRASSCQW